MFTVRLVLSLIVVTVASAAVPVASHGMPPVRTVELSWQAGQGPASVWRGRQLVKITTRSAFVDTHAPSCGRVRYRVYRRGPNPTGVPRGRLLLDRHVRVDRVPPSRPMVSVVTTPLQWPQPPDTCGRAVSYEVFRDGVMLASGPDRLWSDVSALGSYTVRAIDEAGNVSHGSPAVILAASSGGPLPHFRIPLRGRVIATESGADGDHNHHQGDTPTGNDLADDLLSIDTNGYLVHRKGKALTDWIGWSTDIRAAAPGLVVIASDGLHDLEAGEKVHANQHPAGNHVVIQQDDGSYTWYAHMRFGSVRTGLVGRRVEAGTPLGQMGNSGSSAFVHLHLQRQTGGIGLYDVAASPLPIAFDNVLLFGTYHYAVKTGCLRWTAYTPAVLNDYQPHRCEVFRGGRSP